MDKVVIVLAATGCYVLVKAVGGLLRDIWYWRVR